MVAFFRGAGDENLRSKAEELLRTTETARADNQMEKLSQKVAFFRGVGDEVANILKN
jgi:hypothetical protein